MIPSYLPSSFPTKTPTMHPTLFPSLPPTTSPTSHPTSTPTLIPTLSVEPTDSPSEFSIKVDISPFEISVITENSVDENLVFEAAETFLNTFLKQNLEEDNVIFSHVELTMEKKRRRRLNVQLSILCKGFAVFKSKSVPDTDVLQNLIVEDAFTLSREDFLDQLESSGVELSQSMKSDGNGKDDKALSTAHLTLILAIGGAAVAAIAVSLYVQSHHKRGSEKKVQAYGQQYQAKAKEFNFDIDFLEPQPLEISDDDKAIERNMVRSEYERTVIRKANESLQLRIGEELPGRVSKAVRFGTNIAYGSNGSIEDESKRYDEEATISSIHFSSSLESNISSLGGLNPIPEYDETNIRSPEGSPDSSSHCNALSDKNVTPRSCSAVAMLSPTNERTSPKLDIGDLPSKSPRSLSVAAQDDEDEKEPLNGISSTIIGVLSPQSILSSIGFSFGSDRSEPFRIDSLDEDSDEGDEPTIDSALYHFSVSTAELPPNAKIQTSTDADEELKSPASKSKRPNLLKRLVSPRSSKIKMDPEDNKPDEVAALTNESTHGDNLTDDNLMDRAKPSAIPTGDKNEDATFGRHGADLVGLPPNERHELTTVDVTDDDNEHHAQTGILTDQNVQGENSYFTSIFTRKY
jgi:hypothetical protein